MKLIIGNRRYSSWSMRPWVLMRTAGIPFEEIRIALRQPDSLKKIRRYSPGGRVPVLVDGAVTVWESLAICQYLSEKFPRKRLWPAGPSARAAAQSLSHEMHAGFQELRKNLPTNFAVRYRQFTIPKAARPDIARVVELIGGCRKKWGKGGPFLFGKYTIADAMFTPVVFRFLTYRVPVPPVVRDYMRAIEELPACREWTRAAAAERERIADYEDRGR